MDWQKQDNELRKLMDGEDFLPEGEAFNERRAWQKLNAAMRPKAKVLGIKFMRIAAAACFLGAVAFFVIKYNTLQNKNEDTIMSSVTQETKKNEGPLSNEYDTASIVKESGLVPEKEIVENKKIDAPVVKESRGGQLNKTNLIQFEETILNENGEKEAMAFEDKKQPELTQKDPSLEAENATAKLEDNKLLPTKTPKIKVVHYNELNRNNTITPPGFAKSNKSEELLNALVLGNSSLKNQNETFLQIKIELTPQVKKSL